MNLETPIQTVELVMAIATALMGISHIVQPGMWRAYFEKLHIMGLAGVALNGQFTIIPGLLIVTLHPVWHGPGIVLTLYGWSLLIKTGIILLAPALGLRSLEMAEGGGRRFLAAGLMLLVVSGFSAYAMLSAQ
jgi:hypothetical protein